MSPLSPGMVLTVAGGALVMGIAFGIGGTAAFYSPRLEAAVLRADMAGTAVREQNREVTRMKEAADAREARAKAVMLEAQASQSTSKKLIAELLARKQPANRNACEASCDLIEEVLP